MDIWIYTRMYLYPCECGYTNKHVNKSCLWNAGQTCVAWGPNNAVSCNCTPRLPIFRSFIVGSLDHNPPSSSFVHLIFVLFFVLFLFLVSPCVQSAAPAVLSLASRLLSAICRSSWIFSISGFMFFCFRVFSSLYILYSFSSTLCSIFLLFYFSKFYYFFLYIIIFLLFFFFVFYHLFFRFIFSLLPGLLEKTWF